MFLNYGRASSCSFYQKSQFVLCGGLPLVSAWLLFLSFCVLLPLPLSRDPFTQRSPITSLHYSALIFRVEPQLCVKCALHPS